MFVKAIDVAAEFTRPIHTISRCYGTTTVQPGAATLFFVNSDGVAVTCRHVADGLIAAEQIAKKYEEFRAEVALIPKNKSKKSWRKELERKYGFTADAPIQVRNNFVNCVDSLEVDIVRHASVDLALLRFKNFGRLHCTTFPKFPRDTAGLKQGKFLCRLGFPFPEFTNFQYNGVTDTIEWTPSGRDSTPRFPIEGMVTRHLLDSAGGIVGFEMSTPGLRGQSGGPAFDSDGIVWGMQAATAHLDLNFDIDQEVQRGGRRKRVTESAFLNVGHCVHADVIKAFLRQHSVHFDEI